MDLLHQPIVLLGMHRSGTSLIARLLDELGLFQGATLQEDHESTHFLEINDTLLKRAGASWDHPAPFKDFLRVPAAADLAARCLTADIDSRQISGYLGMLPYMKYRALAKFDQPWGWKDPRSIFTLPLWLRVFPKAKLVYIVRNGVDVGSSLRVRELRELERREKEFPAKAKKLASHPLLERAGFKGSARCLSLDGAFSLWEEYVAEAEARLAEAPNERVFVNYEEFLADPKTHLPPLAAFCGLKATSEAVTKAVASVNAGRAKAFRSDAELSEFYEKVKATRWMKEYGYGGIEARRHEGMEARGGA